MVSKKSQITSCKVTDGASVVLLMTRQEAIRRSLPILGAFRSFAAVGVDPAIMGIGPTVAIPAAVSKAGLSVDDIDLFELNEAFASQAAYSIGAQQPCCIVSCHLLLPKDSLCKY